MGFRVEDLGFRVWGCLGIRLGSGIRGLRCAFSGHPGLSDLWVPVSGFLVSRGIEREALELQAWELGAFGFRI